MSAPAWHRRAAPAQAAASGVVYLTAANGATAVLAYGLHAVAARWFSPIGYGPFTVAVTLIFWLKILLAALLLPGFRKAISEDPSRLREAVRLGWRWYAPLSMSVLVVFLTATPWLSRVMGEPSLAPLLVLAAIDLPLSALLLFTQAALGGLRQYRRLAATLVAYSLARSAGAIGLILLGLGAGAALAGLALGSAVGGAVGAIGVAACLRSAAASEYAPLLRRSWSWTVAIVPASFGWATIGSLDLWMVQALTPARDGGLYAAAFMVATVPKLLLQGLTMAVFPRLSGALAAGEAGLARSIACQAERLALLVLPGVCAIVATNAAEFLGLLMSAEYAPAGRLLQVLFVGGALAATTELLLGVPPAADRPRVRMAAILALLALDAVLLRWWIPTFGALGAAWANLVVFAAGTLLGLWLAHRFTGALPPMATVMRVGLATLLLLAVGARWHSTGFGAMVEALALGAIYLGALAATREIRRRDLELLWQAIRPARPAATVGAARGGVPGSRDGGAK